MHLENGNSIRYRSFPIPLVLYQAKGLDQVHSVNCPPPPPRGGEKLTMGEVEGRGGGRYPSDIIIMTVKGDGGETGENEVPAGRFSHCRPS